MATVTHDLTEIVKALRKALLADPDLVAMLGAEDGVWREVPTTKLTVPAMVLLLGDEGHQLGDTHASAWRPEIRVDVISEGYDQGRKLHGYLQQAWVIPQQRRQPVQSQWLRLDGFYPFSSVLDAGRVQLQSSGQWVYQTSVWWKGRVVVRAAP